KRLVETPEWTYAARGDFRLGAKLRFGIQGKYVGERFATDLNDQVAPDYLIVDVDASYEFAVPSLRFLRAKLNVSNLFDEEYYGNISSGTGLSLNNPAFFQIGAPRSVQFSIYAGF
ncbi:MAG: TonB-dependent receptor, partial [Gammaproteobacteria bacterium]|nr:TonB-dependent receptor [Gammaproteobacteria bacterium]